MRFAKLFEKPVLAFESALGGCTVAVLSGDKTYARTLETQRDQAAKLIPLTKEVMAEAGVAFDSLGLIVTLSGPGSFTGLRIGLSGAKAMARALGIPLQGVETLEAMAYSAVPQKSPCFVILETKRNDFYVQAFDAEKKPIFAPQCMEQGGIETAIADGGYVLCGDGLPRFNGAAGQTLINPVVLAKLGVRKFETASGAAARVTPLYLRGADVTLSSKPQREIIYR